MANPYNHQDETPTVQHLCGSSASLWIGSEIRALTNSEEKRIYAFGWKCLRRICNVRWSDFITNVEIHRRTGAQPLSSVIQRRCLSLSLLGHIARMPESSDTRSLLVSDVPGDWRRLRGRPRSSWLRTVRSDLDLTDTSLHCQGQDRVETDD